MTKKRKKEEQKTKLHEFNGKEIDLTAEVRLKINFNGYHFHVYSQGDDIVILKNGLSLSDGITIKPAAGNVILLR